MFARHRLRHELGDLVTVHRPVNPVLAWGLLAAVSLPFAVYAALGPPGPLIGLALFLGFLIPLAYLLGEWILLQHRIYEHAIVFRSIPGLRTYVVPFYSVEPDRIQVTGRHRVPKGEFRLAQHEHRECPVVETSIRVTALNPERARELARGKLAWDSAGAEAVARGGAPGPATEDVVDWQASFRDPERYSRLLRETALASRHARPYHQA